MSRRIKINRKKFRKTWKRLAKGLGRRIAVYRSDIESECPACYYDKVNRTSSGVSKLNPGDPNYFVVGRCPVCNGRGVLITTRKRCIDGIIIWNPGGEKANNLTFTEAGYEGATSVEIKIDPCHLSLIKSAKHLVIDGIRCKAMHPPLIRGLGGKDILIVRLFTVDKPKIDSGEII